MIHFTCVKSFRTGAFSIALLWSMVASAGEPRSVSDLKMTFVPIPAGSFSMGSPAGEPGRRNDEGPVTRVTISKEFWLGQTEVTHAQWRSLMGSGIPEQVKRALTDDTIYNIDGTQRTVYEYYRTPKEFDPERFIDNRDDDAPMYWVNWHEAVEFCQKLTERERTANRLPQGYVYRLVTEAEWEYACRAGTTTATYVGDINILGRYNAPVLDEIAWYGGNSSVGWTGKGISTDSWQGKQYPGGRAGQHTVATRKPNAWGLYDMLGNVWEWCGDWHGPSLPGGEVTDPVGPQTGTKRISRGGSWMYAANGSRSAKRFQDEPGARFRCVGFRVALAPEPRR